MLFVHAALSLRDRFRVESWRRWYKNPSRNRLQGRRNNKRRPGLGPRLLVAAAHVSIVVYFLGIIFEARGKSHGVLPLVRARLLPPPIKARDSKKCDRLRQFDPGTFRLLATGELFAALKFGLTKGAHAEPFLGVASARREANSSRVSISDLETIIRLWPGP